VNRSRFLRGWKVDGRLGLGWPPFGRRAFRLGAGARAEREGGTAAATCWAAWRGLPAIDGSGFCFGGSFGFGSPRYAQGTSSAQQQLCPVVFIQCPYLNPHTP
jgi:hypothetical protein